MLRVPRFHSGHQDGAEPTGSKDKKIRAECRQLLEAERVSACALSRLIGKMNATKPVFSPAPLFYRNLQIDLAAALRGADQDYETILELSPDSQEELIWCNTQMIKWNGRTVISTEPNLTMESDASTQGWGASSQGISTGGPWSLQEKWHINWLELLAATLALKTFLKSRRGMSVLLKIDNTMTVAYINNQGGTVSKELVSLTRDFWMWCLKRNIHIQAQYWPGIMNDVAERESRSMTDWSDWKLDRSIFLMINEIYGPPDVDLFASRLTNQCRHYFSWRPDPFAEATDAFLQDWTRVKGSANPPWNQECWWRQCQGANIILVTPCGRQPWYPLLLSMLVDWPCLLPKQDTITESVPIMPQLAVWSISGKDWASKAFQARLRTSSSNHGGQKPISHMTHCLGNGTSGVLNGVQIHFQDL